MRAQAIVDLIDHIKNEIESKKLVSQLRGIIDIIQIVSKPDEENHDEDLNNAKAQSIFDLRNIEPENWLYSKTILLNEIDRKGIIGKRGAQNLIDIFESNRANPAGLIQQINHVIEEIDKLCNIDTELIKSFIVDEESIEGKSLITLMFEGNTAVNSIDDLESYIRIWSKIISNYSGLINTGETELIINCLDKKYMIIEIPEGDNVLESISFGAARIIETYKKILRIKKLQLEAVTLSLDKKIYNTLEDEVKFAIEQTTQKIVAELMVMNNIDDSKNNEDFFACIRDSLGQIVGFIDKGGKIECVSSTYSANLVNGNKLFLTANCLVDEIDKVSTEINDIILASDIDS